MGNILLTLVLLIRYRPNEVTCSVVVVAEVVVVYTTVRIRSRHCGSVVLVSSTKVVEVVEVVVAVITL